MKDYNVIDFRFAEITDKYNLVYTQQGVWSRPYEYQYVIDFIKINMKVEKPHIHNSSWGFEGVHVIFRDELDTIGDLLHSDIVHSSLRSTYYYDITTQEPMFENKFDFVINVSTIEHLDTPELRIRAIDNLFKQVKPNGYLILTFDYPRVNLNEIQKFLNKECANKIQPLNGGNSINPNNNYENLNIVYLIIQKNE